MPQSVKIVFGLLGGLAIFIFGMNLMSETLQKVAGERMKKILALLTKNSILGVLAGALTTAVLQSSSATTVMAIGFVSAGLMSLPQAISIIFGANIGTTITAQIIAFKITNYIYLFIFIGFAISFLFKSQRVKNIGQTIFAFGLLFLGIETMGGVMKPLATSPIFTDMIAKVADIPVLGVLVGTFMTLVVQSSSATIAVLQNFAMQDTGDGITSVISLAGAIPILLGDNIGTTVTALLASIGQGKDARRTALAHSLFNISGCLLFIWFVPLYAEFIQWISPAGNEIAVISRQIANAHTGFNLTMTLLWIPFVPFMVWLVMKIVPEKNPSYLKDPREAKFLDTKLVNQPIPAMELVTKEIVRTGDFVKEMLSLVKNSSERKDLEISEKIAEKSQITHSISTKISDYMATMFSIGSMTEFQANNAANLLYISSDIDRINQLCFDITENISLHLPTSDSKKDKKSKKEDFYYSPEALKELKKSADNILNNFTELLYSFAVGKKDAAEKLISKKDSVTKQCTKLRQSHISRVCSGKCNAKHIASYNTILNDIDRIENGILNIAESMMKIETQTSQIK